MKRHQTYYTPTGKNIRRDDRVRDRVIPKTLMYPLASAYPCWLVALH